MTATSNGQQQDIVPFGKYRDRPVTDLLADRAYVDWLLSQPWFPHKQPNIYNVIIGAGGPEPQDTPEHNAMQARYLDPDLCRRLGSTFVRSRDHAEDVLTRHVDTLAAPKRANLDLSVARFDVKTSDPEFEYRGWDVAFRASGVVSGLRAVRPVPKSTADCPWCRESGRRHSRHGIDCPAAADDRDLYGDDGWERWTHGTLSDIEDRVRLRVELKPSIADDYPSVLRDVLKRIDRDAASGAWSDVHIAVVVTDWLEPSSVTAMQVGGIFASRNVRLMLSSEFDHLDLGDLTGPIPR